MAHAIVSLSTNLAHLLRTTPRSTPALAQADVERIVRRTEQHFTGQIVDQRNRLAALEAAMTKLREENQTLTQVNDDLKHSLQHERRQRLECEEQSQRMNEAHAKQVFTLESRLRKLEKQVPDSGGLSVRGTPRSSRSAGGRLDEDLLDSSRQTESRVRSDAVLSTTAVNDFLSSIGKELDAINAMEASRERTLNAI
jgi:hypothetical protein